MVCKNPSQQTQVLATSQFRRYGVAVSSQVLRPVTSYGCNILTYLRRRCEVTLRRIHDETATSTREQISLVMCNTLLSRTSRVFLMTSLPTNILYQKFNCGFSILSSRNSKADKKSHQRRKKLFVAVTSQIRRNYVVATSQIGRNLLLILRPI